ncbi:hypothetical protein Trydic_g8765, partial [Trypoxylus dichotomus]
GKFSVTRMLASEVYRNTENQLKRTLDMPQIRLPLILEPLAILGFIGAAFIITFFWYIPDSFHLWFWNVNVK